MLAGWAAHINFEPAGAPVPAGYVADTGAVFGDRGNGLAYGWNQAISVAARDRNVNSDQRYDTFIHMQLYGTRTWEIAVPNGSYTVHLVAGDPSYTDGVYKLAAEGKTILSGTPTAAQHWVESTTTVTVNDGRLTISNGVGAVNDKIDFIDITSLPTTPSPPPPPPPPPPALVPQPFHGAPSLAGRPIEAEDFDLGGDGVAYHDSTTANLGGGYRNTGVDVQSGGSNGFNVGYTQAGEWLQYTITTPQADDYVFTARVASQGAGGKFHVSFDGANLTGTLAIPNTGTWDTFATVASGKFHLSAGTHVMRIWVDSNSPVYKAAGNFDTFFVTPIAPGSTVLWTPGPASPAARFEGYGRVVNGKLYTFGGYTNVDPFGATNQAAVYDPTTNSWTSLGTMPIPETHCGVAVDEADGLIFFVGGLRGLYPGDSTTDVWQYNTATNVWSRLPSLPEPLSAGTADFVDGQIDYFGGNRGQDRVTDYPLHYVLTLGDTSWHTAAPMPAGRDHVASAVLNGRIYLMGGEVGHDTLHQQQIATWCYDPASDTWTTLAAMPVGKSHAESSTFVYNGAIYVAGGQGDNFKASDTFLRYDPASDTWSQLPPLPVPLEGTIVQPLGDKLVVTCGYIGNFGAASTRTWLTDWNG